MLRLGLGRRRRRGRRGGRSRGLGEGVVVGWLWWSGGVGWVGGDAQFR